MQFLLDNPFILIILLGILSSMFKTNKEKPANKKPTRQASTTSTENPPPSNPMAEVFRELVEEAPAKPIYNEYVDTKKEAEAKIAALKKQQEQYADKVSRMNTLSRINEQSQPLMESVAKSGRTFKVEGEKLADAIIWSEILGPPRAKKPHRSMNFRSR
ncbi:hypothetical protein PZE06_08935 [Robertmurraya sp. DFI.2.37]|uniref:hypothetical protein n=1 Tax=Robertmurraya sp. DFI.2.37 TaxID=3031819 RepID=UPI0012480DC5|nr:hypothetical protein [Robertmurraya sp. DFI.2.37]MDF1508311.1 hypothetical protein [Robertmurraya sp. DFI.2.37]